MTISVECKCGKKFEVPTILERHKINDKTFSICIGSMLCPNPACKQVIHVEIVAPENPVIHGSVDWDKIKESDILYFNGKEYRIALKTMRKSDRVLYLRPITTGENIVVEVGKNGKVAGVWWTPEEMFSIVPLPLRTMLGYESWTEDQLNTAKANSIGTDE